MRENQGENGRFSYRESGENKQQHLNPTNNKATSVETMETDDDDDDLHNPHQQHGDGGSSATGRLLERDGGEDDEDGDNEDEDEDDDDEYSRLNDEERFEVRMNSAPLLTFVVFNKIAERSYCLSLCCGVDVE